MTRLGKRAWRVRVDTLQFTELDISFDVEKTLRREPNKVTLKIWNLTGDQRSQLQQLSVNRGSNRIRVELEAGYVGATSLIFRGDLRTAESLPDGPDWVTTIAGEDGGRSVLWSRINRSFRPGTPVVDVVRACADAMGLGQGNLEEIASRATLEGLGSSFRAGTTLSGSAPEELEGILRSLRLTYSIQNGNLQLLERGRALQSTAVRLTSSPPPGTGLTGAPSVQPDGVVKVQALMVPDIYPGRQIRVESPQVNGTFRVQKAKYVGDTFGDSWNIDMECVELVSVT